MVTGGGPIAEHPIIFCLKELLFRLLNGFHSLARRFNTDAVVGKRVLFIVLVISESF